MKDDTLDFKVKPAELLLRRLVCEYDELVNMTFFFLGSKNLKPFILGFWDGKLFWGEIWAEFGKKTV